MNTKNKIAELFMLGDYLDSEYLDYGVEMFWDVQLTKSIADRLRVEGWNLSEGVTEVVIDYDLPLVTVCQYPLASRDSSSEDVFEPVKTREFDIGVYLV